MNASNRNSLLKTTASAAILLAGMAVTACAPVHTRPVAVAASNPTITYVYHNDGELLQANDQAAGYCAQYQSGPHLVRYDQGPDGRIAVFECVQGGPVGAGPVAAGPGYGAPTQIAYDSYYDDYYGPYYGGYWAGDGYFYFTDGPGRPYRRDDLHHFRRDGGVGFHGVRTTVVHTG